MGPCPEQLWRYWHQTILLWQLSGQLTVGYGIENNTCCDSGGIFAIAIFQIIKELGVDLEPLTKELIIIEALGSKLDVLRNARIFMEVSVIAGTYDNKEILVSLKRMKS